MSLYFFPLLLSLLPSSMVRRDTECRVRRSVSRVFTNEMTLGKALVLPVFQLPRIYDGKTYINSIYNPSQLSHPGSLHRSPG